MCVCKSIPAGGQSVEVVAGALLAAASAVVDVLAHIGLAAVVLHVVVAVLPPMCTRGLTLSVVALGGAVGVGLALHSTLAAVLQVALGVSLAPVLLLVVAIGPSRGAGVAALAIGASGFGVGVGWALDATIAAVLYILLDACLASVVGVVVAVLEPGFAPRISRPCNQTRELIQCSYCMDRPNSLA